MARRGSVDGLRRTARLEGLGYGRSADAAGRTHDLIIDLRSLTQGVGTFETEFDHLAELTGKLADQVVASHKAAA